MLISLCTWSPAGQVHLIKGPDLAFNYRAALFNPAQSTDASMVTTTTLNTGVGPRLSISIYFQVDWALIIIHRAFICLHTCVCACTMNACKLWLGVRQASVCQSSDLYLVPAQTCTWRGQRSFNITIHMGDHACQPDLH